MERSVRRMYGVQNSTQSRRMHPSRAGGLVQIAKYSLTRFLLAINRVPGGYRPTGHYSKIGLCPRWPRLAQNPEKQPKGRLDKRLSCSHQTESISAPILMRKAEIAIVGLSAFL
jgi:hypothetical protein